MTRTTAANAIASVLAATLAGSPAGARGELGLEVSVTVETSPGNPVPTDQTVLVAIGDTLRFVVEAAVSGGDAPAFAAFAADLVPVDACDAQGLDVSGFSFGAWPDVSDDPVLVGSDITGGRASQLPIFGPVDASNPLTVATFSATFNEPGVFIYNVVDNGDDGRAFGVIADAENLFAVPEPFGPNVARSVRVIAIGGGGGGPCNEADLAEPFGVLDLADVSSFVSGFTAQRCRGDVAPPWGVFDLSDVQAFVAAFVAGCP